jgi:hypothetical protein
VHVDRTGPRRRNRVGQGERIGQRLDVEMGERRVPEGGAFGIVELARAGEDDTARGTAPLPSRGGRRSPRAAPCRRTRPKARSGCSDRRARRTRPPRGRDGGGSVGDRRHRDTAVASDHEDVLLAVAVALGRPSRPARPRAR